MGCLQSKTKVKPSGEEERERALENAKERRKKQHLFENLVKEEFLVDIEQDYDLSGRILGSGVSGSVRVCKSLKSGKEFALKTLRKDTMRTENLLALKNEIRIMASTNHPNIIRLYSTYETSKCIYLVTELATGGEVLDHLQKQEDYHYDENTARNIVRQMVNAVRYLHERGIVHRDLKLENFLFVNSSVDSPLKLIDFGLSEFAKSDDVMYAKVGTCYYVAPEVLAGEYNASCDCWAMGVIAYMLLCGYPPFNGADDGEILHRVKVGQYHFAHSPFRRVSEEAKDFIRKLLVMEPEERMTMADAQNHPWMEREFEEDLSAPNQTEEEIDFSKQVIRNLAKFSSKKTLQKIALEVVAYSIGSTEYSPMRRTGEKKGEIIDMLRREFQRIDTDGTGEIDFVELKDAMANTHVRDEELLGIFENLDIDNSGTINFTEFLAAAIPEDEIDEEHIRWAFERLSGQEGDVISKEELTEILGVDKTEDEIEAMLDEAIDYSQKHHRHRKTPAPSRLKTKTSGLIDEEKKDGEHSNFMTPPRVLKIKTRDLGDTPVTRSIDYDTFLALIKSVPTSVNSPYFKSIKSEKLNTPMVKEEEEEEEC